MNHEVDLKNNILRTDLAVELIEKAPTKQIDDIKITNITLNKQEAEQIIKNQVIIPPSNSKTSPTTQIMKN